MKFKLKKFFQILVKTIKLIKLKNLVSYTRYKQTEKQSAKGLKRQTRPRKQPREKHARIRSEQHRM